MSTASVLVPIEYSRIMHAATRFASSLRIRRLKKCAHECCRFIRDANDFVRCRAIEFEIEFGFRASSLQSQKRFSSLRPRRRLASAVRLIVMLTRGVCRATPRFFAIALAEVTTPLAMRPGPPSFSLAKRKIVSPLAMCLPPYIVFCALNANVLAHGSLISALIANIMLLMSYQRFIVRPKSNSHGRLFFYKR